MIYFLAFVAVVLASARLTALLLWDAITAPWRDKKLDRHPPGTKLHKLLTCHWCMSFWTSLLFASFVHGVAVGSGWLTWHTLLLSPVSIFACAYATGWVLDMEKERELNVRAD